MEIEPWRRAFRDGFLPSLSDADLLALHRGLATDDPRLLQGVTCRAANERPGYYLDPDAECVGGCLMVYPWLAAANAPTVGGAQNAFAMEAHGVRTRCGGPAALSDLTCFFDQTPRPEMRRLLLPEIERGLRLRGHNIPERTVNP